MDPVKNPFSPGAGAPPPELVGREAILEQARVLLGRIKEKRPEKSILLTGLRGVGKTVLLNEIERLAAKTGYRSLGSARGQIVGGAACAAVAQAALRFGSRGRRGRQSQARAGGSQRVHERR